MTNRTRLTHLPTTLEELADGFASLAFTLPMPPSSNRYWRHGGNGKVYRSDEANAYLQEVSYALIGLTPFENCEVEVKAIFYFGRKQGDLDNRLKILLDALQGRAYVNDKQISTILAYRGYDKANPRVLVEVKRIE